MRRQHIFLLLASLAISSPVLADGFYRCSNPAGDIRTVQNIDLLPDEEEWACEKVEMVKIVGEKDDDTSPEEPDLEHSDTESSSESSKVAQQHAPPFTIDLVREEAAMAKKKGITVFEDEKEMEDLVRLCSPEGGGGVDCKESLFKTLRNISKQTPKKK